MRYRSISQKDLPAKIFAKQLPQSLRDSSLGEGALDMPAKLFAERFDKLCQESSQIQHIVLCEKTGLAGLWDGYGFSVKPPKKKRKKDEFFTKKFPKPH